MDSFIDIYCERLGPGLLAEPVNALTNASFFMAAFLGWRLARLKGGVDNRTGILLALLLMIGTGSTLFHTTATYWAMLSDTLPILFYQIAFLQFYASRVMSLPPKYNIGLLGLYIVTVIIFGLLPQSWLNGSIGYIPAFLFLLGLSYWHWRHAQAAHLMMAGASALFLASLIFRTVDMPLCESWPLGTHFLWHILNGIVLYYTTCAYILNKKG